ncbi:uncharacterized protein PHACADRAFT_214787 [Phanerochaete carnosa HHB-10118-sp]|uniref:F-box domain-containing protein n=1 Tax=Phanerochaete carnosa (strain HHB-10118-sp) TaxID=650164 RepID=K5VPG0_PHACS|nr:uncharacterized protein PHACADRAFT_214787 [Phanerochaete carnosa HHB-10118-sp]EKM48464.1 hypothetical protein PHACADRAFT_214787 [Phanerochaete carnosa HHB-10118-sp]
MARLDELPPELYAAIFEQFEGGFDERQQTIVALVRAIPRSPVPDDLLFERIHLTKNRQAYTLYRRLRKNSKDADRVRIFTYECWTAHADYVVNLLKLLHQVEEMTLFFGPDFAPEHLEEIFEKPKERLKMLQLRFRPYVQRAMYQQFLKGAYFDSTLEVISRWPRACLPTLSLIQDPLDPKIAPAGGFAQPLVFFRLDPISTLAASPYVSTVANFRFRIPSRQIARHIAENESTLPSVELLDVSTTNVSEKDLDRLLSRLSRLKYLIMDECPIVSQRADALEAEGAEGLGQWTSVGLALAVTTIARTKLREQRFKVWLQTQAAPPKPAPAPPEQPKARSKKGRKGLATATISLRKSPPKPTVSLPIAGPSTLLFKDEDIPERILVIPPLPTIRSLAITAPMVSPDRPEFEANRTKVLREFERGWSLGIGRILGRRQFLKNSWRAKTAIYKVVPDELAAIDDDRVNDVMYELEQVKSFDDFDVIPPPAPVLCLVGPGKSRNHPEGCPHRVAWERYQDEL